MAALVWNYDGTCAFAEQQLTAAWGGGGGEGVRGCGLLFMSGVSMGSENIIAPECKALHSVSSISADHQSTKLKRYTYLVSTRLGTLEL